MLFTFFVFEWKCPFWANLVQKIKIVTLCWNLVPSLIRICRTHWCYSLFCFWVEIPFLDKFGPKSQNSHFKLKFGTYTNSNMQNSMAMFIFLVFEWKYPFWANLVQKVKIISWSWNLVARHNSMMLFSFLVFEWKYPFWANLVQKIKILTLSWNLVRTLVRTCRIQWWCSFFLFLIGNTLFGQILSKTSKFSL